MIPSPSGASNAPVAEGTPPAGVRRSTTYFPELESSTRRPQQRQRTSYFRSTHRLPPQLLSVLLLAACLSGCHSSAPAGAWRLVDHAPGSTPAYLFIDGLQKRILDSSRPEHTVMLTHAPPRPVLSFAVGLMPSPQAATVRFQIQLQPRAGKAVNLYQKDLSTPGWVDERIDLAPYEIEGSRLVLRQTLLAGPKHRLLQSGWGDPVLLPSETANHPSVLLISIDTLRADRVGVYGYSPGRTPVIDALAHSGVWYEQAYSPSTWTVPSHASLFYGRHLATVPVEAESPRDRRAAPDSRVQPLAEILRDAGYLTAGFTGGGYLSRAFGFPRGFDTYYMFPQEKCPKGECPAERFDGPEVFRRATAWLHDRGHVPFFLFIHTYDVHDRCPFLTPGGVWPELAPADNARLLAFYDELIANVDSRLGALLDELDQSGLANNTLVVFTSDHGEFFSEHGLRGHGPNTKAYEEVVRVPLILRYPSVLKQPVRVTVPVSLVDVAPTILALVGLASDPGMDGSVLPGLGHDGGAATRPVYVSSGDVLTVRQGPLKLIVSRANRFREQVYDVEQDPTEKHNLVWRRGLKIIQQLRPLADGYWKVHAAKVARSREAQVDTETRERLRALGY